jgi:hypothetical protein
MNRIVQKERVQLLKRSVDEQQLNGNTCNQYEQDGQQNICASHRGFSPVDRRIEPAVGLSGQRASMALRLAIQREIWL